MRILKVLAGDVSPFTRRAATQSTDKNTNKNTQTRQGRSAHKSMFFATTSKAERPFPDALFANPLPSKIPVNS